MAIESFQVNVPKDFLPFIEALEGPNLDTKVKISLALALFVNKQVTLARAAELSGKSLGEFIDLLRSNNIPWIEFTEEELKE